MFIYCNNDPVNYVDYTGESAAAILTAAGILAASDGPLPFGDVLAGVLLVVGSAVIVADVLIKTENAAEIIVQAAEAQKAADDSPQSVLEFTFEKEDEVESVDDSNISLAKDYDPNPYRRAGEKKQNRENRNKSREKDDWQPRNNKRDGKPAKPKSHTPSKKGHKKYFDVVEKIDIF